MSGSDEDRPALPVCVADGEFDLDIPPATGQEYLRRVILEARDCPRVVVANIDPRSYSHKQTVQVNGGLSTLRAPQGFAPSLQWQKMQAANFSDIRQKFSHWKARLKSNKTPRPSELPQRGDVEAWCRLSFGRLSQSEKKLLENRVKSNSDGDSDTETMESNGTDMAAIRLSKMETNDTDKREVRTCQTESGQMETNDIDTVAAWVSNAETSHMETNDTYTSIQQTSQTESCQTETSNIHTRQTLTKEDNTDNVDTTHSRTESTEVNNTVTNHHEETSPDTPLPVYERSPPLLSIVAYMDQPTVISVLEYHVNWFEVTGFSKEQGEWLYALMVCLEKPLDPEACSLLRHLARLCSTLRATLDNKDHPYLAPLNVFISLVAHYFDQKDLADDS